MNNADNIYDIEASCDTNQTVGAIICDYIDPELKKIQMLEEKNNQLINALKGIGNNWDQINI